MGLASELERAQVRIAELEARLGRDSTTSSSPLPPQPTIGGFDCGQDSAAGGSLVAGKVPGA